MATEQLKVKIAGEIALSEDPGAAMKKWREVFGITQTQLSEYLHITSSTISDYESNRRKSPGIVVVHRFIDALFALDTQKGGEILKRFQEAEAPVATFFDAKDFSKAVTVKEFAKAIDAKILAGEEKVDTTKIYGATVIDAVKVILELPYESFVKVYGTTNQRALVFTNVDTGRSTMVAVRMAPIKPAVVVLHGVKDVDRLAVKLAESEGMPLLLVNADIEEVKKKIREI